MIILLDLDDTVFINGKLHSRFDDFRNWVAEGDHEVIVWSSHEDGEAIASLMKFGYSNKDDNTKPEADVVIDDSCYNFENLCSVDVTYSSLDSFLESIKD